MSEDRVVIAPNAFKGTLSAWEVAESMDQAAQKFGLETVLVPVADGGEGTAEILAEHFEGRLVSVKTQDALGRPMDAPIADLGEGRFAIDAASACGLAKLGSAKLQVLSATSYGLGDQVRAALEMGAKELLIGVGGTAFVDGGAGMAVALGARLLDHEGRELPPLPAELLHVDRVDLSEMMPQALSVRWTLLVDVDNSLLGEEGAARVYGPQKGAGPEEIVALEKALEAFARAATEASGKAFAELIAKSGAGAGGGLAVAGWGLFGAELVSGAEYVCNEVELADEIADADLVITGEGRFDGQTLRGKAPYWVSKIAEAEDVEVIAVVGDIDPEALELCDQLFSYCASASPQEPRDKREAAKRVRETTVEALEEWGYEIVF